MKIPTKLLWRVLLDVRLQPSDTIDRDYKEICSRYQSEGFSFLTITLPRLDDALLKGLATGRVTPIDFEGFRPRKRGGSLPALLQGFFTRIFDDDGWLLPEPNTCAIFAIRQVTRLFKKVELPCSSQRINAAYERYLSNDQSVNWTCHRRAIDTGLWTSVNGYLWSDLEELSGAFYCFPGIFGSGATAERKRRNERLSISKWPRRCESSFPSSAFIGSREDSPDLSGVSYLDDGDEEPVRVVQVPKTLKTPRTISVEPSYMMLMQQSIAKPLMAYLESKRFGFKSIRFTDQSVNRRLARLGSTDGSLATIDLSDASDLVDLDLVKSMFSKVCPTFLNLILDCRTNTARMPDGTMVSLRKFASMGSALCFPIEAMAFFSIVLYALVEASGKRPSRRLLREIAADVAVYGDDIIVPAKMAPVVMERLEDFGLRVNQDKSFHTGLFRESCGGDYYNGVDVTPTYVRQWSETGTLSDSLRTAYVSLSNTLYMKGLWHASQYVREHLWKLYPEIPLSQYPIGVLHFASVCRSDKLRYNTKLSGYSVRGYRVRVPKVDDSPSTLSGFLGGSFGGVHFSERLHSFRNALCGDDEDLARFASRDNWRSNSSSNIGSQLRENRVKSRVRLVELGLLALEQRSGSHSYRYGDPDSSGSHSKLGRKNLEMLGLDSRVIRKDRLNTSERPHALSLKRGIAATPAGLTW